MKITTICFLALFFGMQFGCAPEQQYKQYDITPILKTRTLAVNKSEDSVKLQLCNELPFEWDGIIVLGSYTPAQEIKNYKLANSASLEKKFPEFSADDRECTLLFLKDNSIVRYSMVPKKVLDFKELLGEDRQSLKISKQLACEKIFIKKSGDKFSFSY